MAHGKKSPCNAGASGDVGSVLGLERSPGRGNGNPFQNSCLGNSMGRGACWEGRVAKFHGVTKSWTQQKRLSTHAHSEIEATGDI